MAAHDHIGTKQGTVPLVLGRRRGRAVLSLAPLIDVTFLLLIFFMLVTQFDRLAAIEVSVAAAPKVELLPREASPGAGAGVVRLAIRPDGALLLGGRELPGPDALDEALPAAAAAAGRREGDEPPLLLVEPEPEVALQHLVRVLAALERQPWFAVRLVRRLETAPEARP